MDPYVRKSRTVVESEGWRRGVLDRHVAGPQMDGMRPDGSHPTEGGVTEGLASLVSTESGSGFDASVEGRLFRHDGTSLARPTMVSIWRLYQVACLPVEMTISLPPPSTQARADE